MQQGRYRLRVNGGRNTDCLKQVLLHFKLGVDHFAFGLGSPFLAVQVVPVKLFHFLVSVVKAPNT
ncbi:hypothetical protein DFAR_3060018 [Desulfarculales bacterium]